MSNSPRQFLLGRINYERRAPRKVAADGFGLASMVDLARRLGNPELTFPVIHVAGTKGKGSTCTMLAGMLQAAGYRTGLYTSPHFEHLEERFQIDGQLISPAKLDELIEQIRPIVDELDDADQLGNSTNSLASGSPVEALPPPTFFEITTAIAFQYFAAEKVDIAIVEVGLGGRLDSTNICRPVVTAITSIGMDHMQILGDSIEEIAAEKAGIIKPAVPVVSGVTSPQAKEVIAKIAAERRSPLYQLGKEIELTNHSHCETGNIQASNAESTSTCEHDLSSPQTIDVRTHLAASSPSLKHVHLSLLGEHQAQNTAVAISVCQILREAGWQIDEQAIRNTLKNLRLRGRIERDLENPRIVVDIAHNVPSLTALLQTATQFVDQAPRTLIFSASSDKDLEGMSELIPTFFRSTDSDSFSPEPARSRPSADREVREAATASSRQVSTF